MNPSLPCFTYKGEYKWRQCPYIKEYIDKIRKILTKARSKRRSLAPRAKAEVYTAEDQKSSLEDSALSSSEDKETFPISRESPIIEWIADTGALVYITNQLYLFRGPLRKVKRKLVKIGGNTKL